MEDFHGATLLIAIKPEDGKMSPHKVYMYTRDESGELQSVGCISRLRLEASLQDRDVSLQVDLPSDASEELLLKINAYATALEAGGVEVSRV